MEILQGRATIATFSLPAGMVEEIKRRARSEDRPFSWIARRAFVAYLSDGATEKQEENSEHS